MGHCLSNRMISLGVALFAALYMFAGAMMATVGLVAFLRMPDVFSTGCIIWTGFVVLLSGVILIVMSICNKHVSLCKSYIMVFLCLVVLSFSIANIVLVKTVEWDGVRSWTTNHDALDSWSNLTLFLTYLLGLLGSVIGLVASFLGTAFVYFTLTVPLLDARRKSRPQYEVHVKRNICDRYKYQPQRKFNFKLTPPPESQVPPTTSSGWGNGQSDLYHVSWVYEDQAQEIRLSSRDVSTFAQQERPVDNKAQLMEEIKEKVGARRVPSTSLDDVAVIPHQMSDDSAPGSKPLDIVAAAGPSEPVMARIGQLPPNARSSFHGRPVLPIRDENTHL